MTVAGGADVTIADTIAGIVSPTDLLKCGKLQVILHNYEWIKIHSMSISWLTTYATWIVSMYDPALSSFGTTQKLESFYERQPSMRTHRSDRNGTKTLSRTANLGMKQCFKDYIRTSLLKTHLEQNTNQCSIKFIAPDQLNAAHYITGIIKFKVSAYGMKDTALEEQDAQMDVAAIE